MKLRALYVVVLVSAWLSAASAQAATVDPNDMERLLDAIARLESHGDPQAVGDGGKALGVYQIHRAYWEDGTEFLGVNWPYRDAADPQKARRVVKAYLLHYGNGKGFLDMARIHNGGPRGHEKEATLCYARKILADVTKTTARLCRGTPGVWQIQESSIRPTTVDNGLLVPQDRGQHPSGIAGSPFGLSNASIDQIPFRTQYRIVPGRVTPHRPGADVGRTLLR